MLRNQHVVVCCTDRDTHSVVVSRTSQKLDVVVVDGAAAAKINTEFEATKHVCNGSRVRQDYSTHAVAAPPIFACVVTHTT